ncbi:hypothetical protein AAHC03_09802 [Spirometra sp. Aus1]
MDSPKSLLSDVVKPDVDEKDSDVVRLSEFASVCSFICCFGEQLGVFLTIPRLGDILSCKTPSDTEVLSTLVVKLLNKARFWTRSDRWQSSLCRLIRTLAYNDPEMMAVSESLTIQQHQDTVGLPKPKSSASANEDCSFPLVPLNLRVKLFLFLLESQFERNPSFKEKVKAISPQTLRLQCIGCDVWGNSYWLFVDAEYNFLFYREPPTDGLLEFISNCPATLQKFLDELAQKPIHDKSFSDLYAEYDAEKLAKPDSTLNLRRQSSSPASVKLDPVSELSTDNQLHLKKESPDSVSTRDVDKLDSASPPSREGITSKEDPLSCVQSPPPHSLSASHPSDVTETSEQVEEEECKVDLPIASLNGCLPSEAVPSATENHRSPLALTPSNCNSADIPINNTCESLEPSEDTGNVKVTHKSKRKSALEADVSAQPPRRSGRQRKPVEFLTMEAFNPPKSSKKKALVVKKASTELGNERRGSKSLPSVENGVSKSVTKKKRHRRGRGRKKSKRRKGSQPWMCSPSQSEGEDVLEADFELQDSNAEDDSPQSSPSSRARDWLDEVESDFDVNACLDGEDALTVKLGRNMERQKRRSTTATAAEVAATELCDDDTPCQVCAKFGSPEWLLLCDQCDLGFHAMCLRPELHFIPEGDWFCPRCLHARLLTDVAARLEELRVNKAKLEATSRMQERLNFVNVSVTNIINEDNRRAKEAARQASRWYLDSSGEDDEEDGESRSSSDAGSFINEESDAGRRQRSRRNLRHRRTTHSRAAAKRRRVSPDSDASSDSASYSSSSSGEDSPAPVRAARQRVTAQYDVNAAFKQLDVLLDADEKYASIKQARKERQSRKHIPATDGAEEGQEVASSGEGSVEDSCLTGRRPKSKVLSSSDSEESASGDGSHTARRRRNRRSGSEDFRPDEEEEESNSSISEEGTSSSSTPSSDNWLSSRRARRSNARRNGRSRNRPRRPIPRFEEDSIGSEDEVKPTRRRAARRVNYKEPDSEEYEEEPTFDGERSAVFENSPARTPPQSSVSGRVRRILSDSEYEPSTSESPDDGDGPEVGEESVVQGNHMRLKPSQGVLPNTNQPSPASSQRELFSCDEDSGRGVGSGGLVDAPGLSPKPCKTLSASPLPSPVFEGSETSSQRLQAPLGSPHF